MKSRDNEGEEKRTITPNPILDPAGGVAYMSPFLQNALADYAEMENPSADITNKLRDKILLESEWNVQAAGDGRNPDYGRHILLKADFNAGDTDMAALGLERPFRGLEKLLKASGLGTSLNKHDLGPCDNNKKLTQLRGYDCLITVSKDNYERSIKPLLESAKRSMF